MKWYRVLLPRIEYILLIAVFWGIIANGPRILNFDGDLPRHILTGNLILQTQRVETTDIFSFRTTGVPSFPHEWLSQVIFALAYNWLGLHGVVLLTALVILITWGILYRHAISRSNRFLITLLIIALGIAAVQLHVLPRPHIFTYLLTAIWILLLARIHDLGSRAWWILPLIMLLWVNMHGMFVLGIIILGIYLVGDFLEQPSRAWFAIPRTRALLLGGGFSALATFLSPSGPQVWEAIASLGSNSYLTSRIPEYQSPNFHLPETWPFILLLLLTMVGLARAREKIAWIEILLVITFTAFALYSSRMIPLFAVVVTPIAAKLTTNWLQSDYPQVRFWTVDANILKINATSDGRIWILAVIFLSAILLSNKQTLDPEGRGNVFDPRFFPVEAVSWLESHPQGGHVFNEFDWGGYLLLRLWPDQQIFMDGHTHIYGETLTREYERVMTLSAGWEDIFGKYDVHWVIVRNDAPLINALRATSKWEIAYEDATATILIRK